MLLGERLTYSNNQKFVSAVLIVLYVQVTKYYLACVRGKFPGGVVEVNAPIGRRGRTFFRICLPTCLFLRFFWGF